MRAVVVGAGLGGLAVAHGLLTAGAEVEVLEARGGIGDSGQGYRININATGDCALRACLSGEAIRRYERTLHRQSDPAVYLYSPGLQLRSRREAPGAPGAIDRGTLRRVLAHGLGDRVRFGRTVTSIAQAGRPDLIVAADGAGSALRQELMPGTGPHPLGRTAIFGRSPITGASRRWTAPVISNSRFCGLADGPTVLALGAYDPPASAAAEPYVMWVLMGPAGELPASGTTPAELARFAVDRTASWDDRATSVLRTTIGPDSFATPLRAVTGIPDVPVRPGVPVAFIGDAIHTMSPAGGEGANTALDDAARLIAQLRAGGPITDAVARYHAGMRTAAGAALRRSASYPSPENQ